MPRQRRASASPWPETVPSRAMPPLELRPAQAIDLGTATDFHTILRATDEALPHDAVLLLEGESIATPVAEFLRAHAAREPRELAPFGGPRAPAFHLPLDALRDLRTLAEDHVRFEVATHLAVYRDEILLWAPRAGDGVISLSL